MPRRSATVDAMRNDDVAFLRGKVPVAARQQGQRDQVVGDHMAYLVEFVRKRNGRLVHNNGYIIFPYKRAESADQ